MHDMNCLWICNLTVLWVNECLSMLQVYLNLMYNLFFNGEYFLRVSEERQSFTCSSSPFIKAQRTLTIFAMLSFRDLNLLFSFILYLFLLFFVLLVCLAIETICFWNYKTKGMKWKATKFTAICSREHVGRYQLTHTLPQTHTHT